MNGEQLETKQERREKKLKKQRERIHQHGRNLATIYKEAIIKRLKHLGINKQEK